MKSKEISSFCHCTYEEYLNSLCLDGMKVDNPDKEGLFIVYNDNTVEFIMKEDDKYGN
jgi:hypothetical protein